MRGLEPPHPCGYTLLKRARLPIPPHRHGQIVADTHAVFIEKRPFALNGRFCVSTLLPASARLRFAHRWRGMHQLFRSCLRPGLGTGDRRCLVRPQVLNGEVAVSRQSAHRRGACVEWGHSAGCTHSKLQREDRTEGRVESDEGEASFPATGTVCLHMVILYNICNK